MDEQFFIVTEEYNLTQVSGIRTKIAGIDCFIRELHGHYIISHLASGLFISAGNTLDIAISNSKNQIEHSRSHTRKRIKLAETNLRYNGIKYPLNI